MKTFTDRIAVVTGAASGIGKAMAETFLEAGMKVVLSDVDQESLDQTVGTFKAEGADVLGVVADVSKAPDVANLARRTLDAFGAVHVLCNNAGVGCSRPNSWEIPLSGWQWVLGVNLMGVVHGIQAFMPIMIEQDMPAHIVNTASVSGLLNDLINTPYSVSKHAVVTLTENLYLELQAKGLKVNVSLLCPGPVNTNIHKSMEKLRPADVPAPPPPSKEVEIFLKAHKIWLQRGMDPLEIGRRVLAAIQNETFYVVPYDVTADIQARTRNLIDQKNPAMPAPPPELMAIVEEVMRAGGRA